MHVSRRGATGRRDLFGDIALLAFLITQACDGVFTYVGVSSYGLHMEANPLISWPRSTRPSPRSRASTWPSRFSPGSRFCFTSASTAVDRETRLD